MNDIITDNKKSVEPQEKQRFSQKQILEWRKQKEERMTEITKKLEEGVRNVFSSGKYEEWLKTMSKFHKYSVKNQLLIHNQKPDAKLVAGYNDWKRKFHRNVKKGSKGLYIFQPAPYRKKVEEKTKDPTTGETILEEKEVMVQAYKVGVVFDYSQTEGTPLPELAVSELEGKIDDYSTLKDALLETSRVPIHFGIIEDSAKGYYSPTQGRILVKDGMSQVHTVKTMIHEMAHSERTKLNDKGIDNAVRRREEIIAESVAYIVSRYYGLDTDDYSFGYVASWSADKNLMELKSSLEEIRQIAHGMIERIDEKILSKSREKELLPEKAVGLKKNTIKVYYEERPHHRSR